MIEKLLRNHPVVTMALVVVSFMIVVCSWLVDEIGIPRQATVGDVPQGLWCTSLTLSED